MSDPGQTHHCPICEKREARIAELEGALGKIARGEYGTRPWRENVVTLGTAQHIAHAALQGEADE